MATIPKSKGFGEVAFLDPGKEGSRAATAISNGDNEDLADGPDINKNRPALVLIVPAEVYMETLFPIHLRQSDFSNKLSILENSPLTENQSRDNILKIAYGMYCRKYSPGQHVFKQGTVSSIVYLQSHSEGRGKLKICVLSALWPVSYIFEA